MRARMVFSTIFTLLLTLFFLAAIAQQPAAQNPPPAPPKLFAGAADVTAMIAKAKAERKPDQPNYAQPIVRLAPYTANLEHRVAGVNAPASVHEREAEMFYVVEGAGTLVTGGTLREEKRTNAENLSGTGIDGGASRRLAKGDWVMVPEKTPHWFTQIDGTLVLMSIHLPSAGGTR
jgi:mannose-6-phosphate isomerase-like protein (cupin superfamily)